MPAQYPTEDRNEQVLRAIKDISRPPTQRPHILAMNILIDETACITLAQLRHQKGRGKTEKPKIDSETATERFFYLAILAKYRIY